jgi:hypothetical protein
MYIESGAGDTQDLGYLAVSQPLLISQGVYS